MNAGMQSLHMEKVTRYRQGTISQEDRRTATRLSSHEEFFELKLAYTGTGEENWILT